VRRQALRVVGAGLRVRNASLAAGVGGLMMADVQMVDAASAAETSSRAWRRRRWSTGMIGVGLLGASLLWGLVHGPTPIPLSVVVAQLLHPQATLSGIILWQIRIPRVLAAAVVGAALAAAGVMMQALLRNPLADPYVIGASAGAGLGAVVTEEVLGQLAPGGAFVGALGAVLISYLLSRARGTAQVLTLLLAGYAVGVILSAVSLFLLLQSRQDLTTVLAWEVGGIHGMTWGTLGPPAALAAVAVLAAWPLTPVMNALLLGDEQAGALGVGVERTQVALLLCSSLLTAAAVYLAGLIGFVGLVIPHIVRRWNGPDHRTLLPQAILYGASFLVLADTLAESVPQVGTVPVGLITAVLGGPYFLWLLLRTQRQGVTF
jgi:iron complex transport system permease protein